MVEPGLVDMFNITAENTPMVDYPVNRLMPLRNFNDLCFNTASEFVEGFGENVANSKGGAWCSRSVIEMLPYAGKAPSEFQLPQPVIQIRPKWFAHGLMVSGGDPERALKICLKRSNQTGANPNYCHSAKIMLEKAYGGDCPLLSSSYSEDFKGVGQGTRESKGVKKRSERSSKKITPKKAEEFSHPKPPVENRKPSPHVYKHQDDKGSFSPCYVVGITVLAVLFLSLIVFLVSK